MADLEGSDGDISWLVVSSSDETGVCGSVGRP